MCARALGTCVASCTDRSARLFLCLKHVALRESWDTWQRQSPPQPGGEVWRHRTRGSVETHLSREARSRAIGYVVVPEST
jgi:hypothetical protein